MEGAVAKTLQAQVSVLTKALQQQQDVFLREKKAMAMEALNQRQAFDAALQEMQEQYCRQLVRLFSSGEQAQVAERIETLLNKANAESQEVQRVRTQLAQTQLDLEQSRQERLLMEQQVFQQEQLLLENEKRMTALEIELERQQKGVLKSKPYSEYDSTFTSQATISRSNSTDNCVRASPLTMRQARQFTGESSENAQPAVISDYVAAIHGDGQKSVNTVEVGDEADYNTVRVTVEENQMDYKLTCNPSIPLAERKINVVRTTSYQKPNLASAETSFSDAFQLLNSVSDDEQFAIPVEKQPLRNVSKSNRNVSEQLPDKCIKRAFSTGRRSAPPADIISWLVDTEVARQHLVRVNCDTQAMYDALYREKAELQRRAVEKTIQYDLMCQTLEAARTKFDRLTLQYSQELSASQQECANLAHALKEAQTQALTLQRDAGEWKARAQESGATSESLRRQLEQMRAPSTQPENDLAALLELQRAELRGAYKAQQSLEELVFRMGQERCFGGVGEATEDGTRQEQQQEEGCAAQQADAWSQRVKLYENALETGRKQQEQLQKYIAQQHGQIEALQSQQLSITRVLDETGRENIAVKRRFLHYDERLKHYEQLIRSAVAAVDAHRAAFLQFSEGKSATFNDMRTKITQLEAMLFKKRKNAAGRPGAAVDDAGNTFKVMNESSGRFSHTANLSHLRQSIDLSVLRQNVAQNRQSVFGEQLVEEEHVAQYYEDLEAQHKIQEQLDGLRSLLAGSILEADPKQEQFISALTQQKAEIETQPLAVAAVQTDAVSYQESVEAAAQTFLETRTQATETQESSFQARVSAALQTQQIEFLKFRVALLQQTQRKDATEPVLEFDTFREQMRRSTETNHMLQEEVYGQRSRVQRLQHRIATHRCHGIDKYQGEIAQKLGAQREIYERRFAELEAQLQRQKEAAGAAGEQRARLNTALRLTSTFVQSWHKSLENLMDAKLQKIQDRAMSIETAIRHIQQHHKQTINPQFNLQKHQIQLLEDACNIVAEKQAELIAVKRTRSVSFVSCGSDDSTSEDEIVMSRIEKQITGPSRQGSFVDQDLRPPCARSRRGSVLEKEDKCCEIASELEKSNGNISRTFVNLLKQPSDAALQLQALRTRQFCGFVYQTLQLPRQIEMRPLVVDADVQCTLVTAEMVAKWAGLFQKQSTQLYDLKHELSELKKAQQSAPPRQATQPATNEIVQVTTTQQESDKLAQRTRSVPGRSGEVDAQQQCSHIYGPADDIPQAVRRRKWRFQAPVYLHNPQARPEQ